MGRRRLVGGLYGVSLGSAFFGESMFSRRTDASKICLVHLVERLKQRGFTLLDTQFTTEHLKRSGPSTFRRALTGACSPKRWRRTTSNSELEMGACPYWAVALSGGGISDFCLHSFSQTS